MPARDRSGLFFMKHNFKKAVAISLAATLVCGCFSGCKKKDDNVATSEATPVTTPTVNQTDTPSVEHNVTGDVDTSGGNKTVSGKPVLTKLVVGTPNNCNQNGYMEATSIDGEYCYKQKEKATKYKNPVPFENGDGSNTILSTGHTVYIRKLYDDAETSNTEDSSSSEVGTVNDNGEQYIITDEHVEYSSGYYDENGNYVETTSDTNKDSSSPLIDENLQKCIISGAEIFDIDNFSNEIEYPSDYAQLRKEGTCERLYIYTSKDAYDQAVKNRNDGQAILNGDQAAPMHCVILNGSLVPNLKFSTNDDGRLCISLRELAEAYDTNTEFDDVAHLLTVPTIYGECIYIPTKGALHNISEYFEISNSDKTFVFTNRNTCEFWKDTFTLADDDDMVMPIEDIARILGWDFWYNDNILSVVTDSLDDTNEKNFILQETQSTTTSYDIEELDESDSDSSDSENSESEAN